MAEAGAITANRTGPSGCAARKAKAPATASKSKVDRVLTAWAAKPKG
jgi:hypothetical protein